MTFKDDLLTDLDVFLNSDEFAEIVTYKGAAIRGVFDDAFQVSAPDGLGIETTQPQVVVKSADVAGMAHGDTMTIKTVVYKVIGIHPDGTGLTTAILSRD